MRIDNHAQRRLFAAARIRLPRHRHRRSENRDLLGYIAPACTIFAFMALVLHHYLALQMISYAVQTSNRTLRYFFFRSAVTVGGAAPLLLLVVVWLAREHFNSWVFYATAGAVAYSGLWTGYDEFARLAAYYPRFSLVTLIGSADLFAVAGSVVPIALSLAALRKARPRRSIAPPVRRAASALHGESNWLADRNRPKRLFDKGGIVIGEACRTDLNPNLGGKAPLLRYDGNAGSGHVLVFAGSGGYKTTGTVVPSALEWRTNLN